MSALAVIFGGPSLEHDVSILTGLQASRVLVQAGAEPVAIYWSESGDWFRVPADLEASAFLDGTPADARPIHVDVTGKEAGFSEARALGRRSLLELRAAVICCHGGLGEDGRLQSILDVAKVPYTGPNSLCASLSMDKLAFSGLIHDAGLPALTRVNFDESSSTPPFAGPYVLKPRFGGSSIGVEVVKDLETARSLVGTSPYYRRGAVLEPYHSGIEDLYIAIRTYPKLQLSLVERPRAAADVSAIYGYREKYLRAAAAESQTSEIPATLPSEIEKRLLECAAEVAGLTRLTGNARLDFLWNGSELWVNELNPVPGALAFRLWAASGVQRQQLLEDMIAEAVSLGSAGANFDAIDRYAADRKRQTLQTAGKIAQKLL
jgi:D-alanine-D-alanine ligase